MGVPLHLQVVQHPGTSSVTALCVGVWLWLLHQGVAPAAVGLSHQRFVGERQWWRLVTAQVSHFELLHLVLNVSSLWGLAQQAEPAGRAGASLGYLATSVLLLLGSGAVCLALHHAGVLAFRRERLRHSTMVGYSCVLFGWMTLIAWRTPGHQERFSLLGLTSVPMTAAPFLLLVVTQVVIPNASFLGHLSGILVGLVLATGWLDWMTPYWTGCLVTWVAIGICFGLVREGRLGLPYVRLLPTASDGEDAQLDLMERAGVSEPQTTTTTTTSTTLSTTVSAAIGAVSAAVAAAARQLSTVTGRAAGRVRPGASTGGTGAGAGGSLLAGPTMAAAGPTLPWGMAAGGPGRVGLGGTGSGGSGAGTSGSQAPSRG